MADIASLDRQYLENGNTYRITSRNSQKAGSTAFPTVYSPCPFPKFNHFLLLISNININTLTYLLTTPSYKAMECNGVVLSSFVVKCYQKLSCFRAWLR